MLAILKPVGQSWYLIGAVILLVEVEPAFRHGKSYLKSRSAIVRKDIFWATILRPVARCLSIENAWVLSFCRWNNHRVQQAFQHQKATRALLLLPHCLQATHCTVNIVGNLSLCRECGLCVIGKILPLQVKHGLQNCVANRSYKAYKKAEEYRPDLIIAVSCLDRSFKGIGKLLWVPSYVIPLTFNHGMCVNTNIDISQLIAAIDTLVDSGK